MSRGRGYHGHSREHAMARKGIGTKSSTIPLHEPLIEEEGRYVVRLYDKYGNLKLKKEFKEGHQAWAYGENWRLLKEGYTYQMDELRIMPEIDYTSLDTILKSLYEGVGWEEGKHILPQKIYINPEDWEYIYDKAKEHGAGLGFVLNRMPSSDVDGEFGIMKGEILLKEGYLTASGKQKATFNPSKPLPKLSVTYIKKNILDKDLWSDLHTNRAKENLELAIRNHFSDYGVNITGQIMSKFEITDEVLSKLRKTYKAYGKMKETKSGLTIPKVDYGNKKPRYDKNWYKMRYRASNNEKQIIHYAYKYSPTQTYAP